MIFRKPYGFLIKHFKLIHLILTGLYIFLAVKVNSLLGYYNDFILGTVGKLDAINYVTNYYIIAVVLSILICIVVYALLRYKKKPRVLYLILIFFIIVVAAMIDLVYGGLETIYIGILDVKTLRLYRDLLRILVIFQYISIGLVLVRGLGFDIKKFNFVEDLHELDIDVSDDEEVELTFGNTEHVQRKVNRGIREFKYYYLENKVFIHVILIFCILMGAFSWYMNVEVINKVYEQGEVFSSDNFQFLVLDTYITEKDFNGRLINDNDKSYVIMKTKIASKVGEKSINTGNIVLNVNYKNYANNGYYGSRFADLGIAYRSQKIKTVDTYLFIFEIPNEDIDKKMEFIYGGETTVKLSPVNLDKEEKSKNYKVGEKIDFSGSILGSGEFNIKGFEMAESFKHTYNYEIDGQKFTGEYDISSIRGAIIKLNISSSFSNDLNSYSFMKEYAILKYKLNDTLYEISNFDNKTPGEDKNNIYLNVDKEVLNASEIWLDIKIRNKHYSYKLK